MLCTVTKEFHFEAAHSLPHLPEGHKCRNLHGHSYRFVVHCRGPVNMGEYVKSHKALSQRKDTDPQRGFVIDYADISAAVSPILARIDHQNLDEIFRSTHGYQDLPTTAEMLALFLYNEVSSTLGAIVHGITVKETANTSVEYMPNWNGAATPR
jgi:6-pyruvoyltetrahydropterin/6-carboxytetrahydropterin synthase